MRKHRRPAHQPGWQFQRAFQSVSGIVMFYAAVTGIVAATLQQ
jgi:hypothetical protein